MNNFFSNLRRAITNFSYGRYGNDQLNMLLCGVCLGLIVLNVFVQSIIVTLAVLVVMIWVMFRTFSRNIYKRRSENEAYLKISRKFTGFFKLQKDKFRDRNTHVYKKCPSCKVVLRLPKQQGEHTVNCPRCHQRFDVVIK